MNTLPSSGHHPIFVKIIVGSSWKMHVSKCCTSKTKVNVSLKTMCKCKCLGEHSGSKGPKHKQYL